MRMRWMMGAALMAGCGGVSPAVDAPIGDAPGDGDVEAVERYIESHREAEHETMPAGPQDLPAADACTREAPCELDASVVDGTFGPGAAIDVTGRWEASYTLTLAEGQVARVWTDADGIDTTLAVEGHGLRLFNDDFWSGSLTSLIQFQAPVAGDYVVRISTFAPGQGGEWSLATRPFEPHEVTAGFLLGEEYGGTVAPGGMGAGSDERVGDSVWFIARAGERVRLRVTSTDFDTVATLVGPTGESWFNDDAQDTGPDGTESPLDSTIEAMAPADGWYQLVVSPYGGQGDGTWHLRSSVRHPVSIGAGGLVPDEGYAGPEQQGRIYGLFVGITAYADSPLYGCADDATFLAAAFAERGLIAPDDAFVFTDADATRGNVVAALTDLSERVGPDDLVVVFFSGHGGVVANSPDPIELDGTDETLVFYDGEISDTQFVLHLDQVNAGTMLLALDACQSGGFARDFMTRPGRIGIFSSDEDVLSSTAEPVGAGGYLSWALREAVLGAGDGRPGDGAMCAGELTDFVLESFVEQHRNMNPEGSNAPYQRAVVERGAVPYSQALWLYPRNADGTFVGDETTCYHSGAPTPVEGQGPSCR